MAARVSSSLAYPDRFYAAAAYVGFNNGSSNGGKVSKFQNDVALLLYGLYKQATAGPCNGPKPRAWNPVEHSKWTSWNGLGNMASTEAMRLFVKILEEEEPAWYSRVSEFAVEPINDIEVNKPNTDSTVGVEPDNLKVNNPLEETKSVSMVNGTVQETQDKDVIMEVLGSVDIYDQWIAPSVFGQRPKPRYEHGSALVQDKMYIFGGSHNGRYLSDLQVLDLRSFTWSKLEPKGASKSSDSIEEAVSPCAGHSMIPWGNKILSVAGHTKNPAEMVTVKEFDPQTCTWSNLKTYGKPPISRGGQSVTLVGDTLVVFGGEDAKRSVLNDLHILDLETMTWDDTDTIGPPPSPRSDHVAACHAGRYLLIFGGGSHSIVFNDLHILDLETMEWSKPKQQGVTPGPRAGHAGATVGENWFIAGGGDNKNGASETLMLNMSTLVWSVVTTVQGRVPLASEGISLVSTAYNGDDFLVSFGGYNGRYSNEVYVLKLSNKSGLQSNVSRTLSNTIVEDLKPEPEEVQDGKIREKIVVDNDTGHEETGERLVASLKMEKEDLEAKLNQEQLQGHQLKEELAGAEVRNTQLTKELQSVRSQLAAEQSRCFKLEVDLAELRQKLQALETLEKEVELLRRQKAASEQAALNAKQKQSSSGVWSWIAGSTSDDSRS